MNKRNAWPSLFILIAILAGFLTPVGNAWVGQAQDSPTAWAPQEIDLSANDPSSAISQDPPTPLPEDCDDVIPPGGTPPACCAHGYVYYGGVPVAGARVTVESPSGSLTVVTAYGPASTYPYYSVNLSDPPLSVEMGEVITVKAVYWDLHASLTHYVVEAA